MNAAKGVEFGERRVDNQNCKVRVPFAVLRLRRFSTTHFLSFFAMRPSSVIVKRR